MLGVTAGPICFSGCFPMLLSITVAESREKTTAQAWFFIGKFLGGRFLAYLSLGLLVAYMGSRLGGWTHWIGTYAWVVMAILLIAYGLGLHIPHLGLCGLAGNTSGSRYFPFVLGGLTGLNLCPPFLLAITYTLQRSIEPAFGICFFAAFFVATSLFILPAGFARWIPHRDRIISMGRVVSVVVGVVFLYQGLAALVRWSG